MIVVLYKFGGKSLTACRQKCVNQREIPIHDINPCARVTRSGPYQGDL